MLFVALRKRDDPGPSAPMRLDAAAPAWLMPGEQARWSRFSGAARRGQFLQGRRMLRELLAQAIGGSPQSQPVDIDEYGRTLAPAGWHASVSHTGAWLAAALATQPIGIDVEDMRRPRDFLALATLVHSTAQGAALRALPAAEQAEGFCRWWTLKEAWLKARGQGLDFALMRRLDFMPARQGDAAVAVLPVPGVVLALQGPSCVSSVLPAELAGEALAWQLLESRLDP